MLGHNLIADNAAAVRFRNFIQQNYLLNQPICEIQPDFMATNELRAKWMVALFLTPLEASEIFLPVFERIYLRYSSESIENTK